MIALLTQLVSKFVCWIETAVVVVFNGLLTAIGTIIGALLAVMPTIPDPPALPGAMTTALSWIAWVFPVGTMISVFAFMFAAWLLWFVVSIVLRWARAIA
jgi:hypothetical protein